MFAALRANDLIWQYVVDSYLKGKAPPAFDLLFWNSDDTNLPGPMFCWYLRNTYLENKLREPGKTVQCGVPVDLGEVEVPAFLYASREDHIVPWQTAYAARELLGGDITFVLGASGHIAGVINPPAKNKRNYWVGDVGRDAKAGWRRAQRAGKLVAGLERLARSGMRARWCLRPRAPGNRQFAVIEPAPGRYVKAKAASTAPIQISSLASRRTPWKTSSSSPPPAPPWASSAARSPRRRRPNSAPRSSRSCSRARLCGEQIGEVILGQVLTAGTGQNPARQSGHQVRPAAGGAGDDHQQGLRLRPEGGHAGRAGDPRRRQPRSSSPAARRA